MMHPEAAQSARLSLQLATLREDVHVPALQRDLASWALSPPPDDGVTLNAMLRKLEIRSMWKQVEVRACR